MLWIKRNLVLVVGGAVSLGLLAYAVFFLWSQYQFNTQVQEQLQQELAEFDRFDTLPQFPSKANIELARGETTKVNAYLAKAHGAFKPSSAPNVNMRELKNLLDTVTFELTRKAETLNVALPARYSFSFEQQTRLMTFQAASVRPLAEQLAEVRAFCPIFFDAKINRLEGIRRYRVSTDDPTSSSDYLDQKPVTNALTKAVFVPYEVTFESFTPELGAAVEGLMRHGFIVRAVSVEQAPPQPLALAEATPMAPTGFTPLMPSYANPASPASRYGRDPMMERYGRGGGGGKDGSGAGQMSDEMKRRYGLMGPGGGMSPDMRSRYFPTPATPPPQTPATAAVRPTPAPGARGLTTVLDEKLLRVTMRFDAMRLGK